jgi:two-component system chemotaxis response regulator CheB
MIKVLVVDDSLIQQELLTHILTSDSDVQVIGTASDGEEAILKVQKLKPDVVTMDLCMPKMDGIVATQKIMSLCPVPIVVICGHSNIQEVATTFQAIEAGAVAVAPKINFVTDSPDELIQTIKLMSEVKVVKRHHRLARSQKEDLSTKSKINMHLDTQLIAIGVSTGGPVVLKTIFDKLSTDSPPILVVQHITAGFLDGLAEWLDQSSKLKVSIAVHGETLKRGSIYLAPDSYQMGVDSAKRIQLTKDEPINGHRPSASFLFNSVAHVMKNKALGILLTGMGYDGANGLKLMKDNGAFTIAQDAESSIVNGMPGEAIAIGAVNEVLSPEEIVTFINNRVINNHEC